MGNLTALSDLRDIEATRAHIVEWFRAAIAVVEPREAVRRALELTGRELLIDGQAVPLSGRLIVIAVGKAAVMMAAGAADRLGDRIDAGFVLTKDGQETSATPAGFEVVVAGHPIPDQRGVAATERILELVHGLGSHDVVLALISGGGSALLEAPRSPLTLADFAATTDALLRAGAPIEALNAVRRPLSRVKAGGLLRAAAPATVHTLILSDVLGNDPRIIASGPTVPGEADPALALQTLDRYGVRDSVPPEVITALEQRIGTEPEGETAPAGTVSIVGDNAAALEALAAAATADGKRVQITARNLAGDAAALGRAWVERARESGSTVDVLLGGGEATVQVRGAGIGGRNTEFALAAAIALVETGLTDWVVASLATDGDDGPTGAAGAIADAGTVGRAAAMGIDAAAALLDNDSKQVFDAAGGLVVTGQTGTNVNDLYLAVRLSASGAAEFAESHE